jgi:hypothetical protein
MCWHQHDVDYYERMGLELGASDEEIKKRYKELALKLHPDKNVDDPDAEQRFKELQETFMFLSSPESKSMIDTWAVERAKKQKLVDDMERKRKKREWEEMEADRHASRVPARTQPVRVHLPSKACSQGNPVLHPVLGGHGEACLAQRCAEHASLPGTRGAPVPSLFLIPACF